MSVETYKAFITGAERTGKSALVERLTQGSFTELYFPTAGTSEVSFEIEKGKNPIILKIIDSSGNTEYDGIPKFALRDSAVVIFVCSYESRKSLEYITDELIPFVNEFLGEDNYIGFTVITHSDIEDSKKEFQLNDLQRIANTFSCITYEVSSKTGESVGEFFEYVKEEIIKNKKTQNKPLATIESMKAVDLQKPRTEEKKNDCC